MDMHKTRAVVCRMRVHKPSATRLLRPITRAMCKHLKNLELPTRPALHVVLPTLLSLWEAESLAEVEVLHSEQAIRPVCKWPVELANALWEAQTGHVESGVEIEFRSDLPRPFLRKMDGGCKSSFLESGNRKPVFLN